MPRNARQSRFGMEQHGVANRSSLDVLCKEKSERIYLLDLLSIPHIIHQTKPSKKFQPVGSLHGDELCHTSQGMAPINARTVHKKQILHTTYRDQPQSTRVIVAYPRPAISQPQSGNIALQSVLINKLPRFSKGHTSCKIEENHNISKSMAVKALSW